ncbi:MAG: ATPase domain-containing protein [Betaproteobacteria bacterium]
MTGVPGLDQIVGGGLLKGGVYLVQGVAGAGKTVLANQIAFNRVAAGGKVSYVTLLAESHARMMQHMELFSFYKEDAIPSALHYVSAFDALTKEGLPGVVRVLGEEMRQRKADLIVLDGLVTAAGASGSLQDLKLFVGQIQALSTLTGCTTLLLNSLGAVTHFSPEQTMVDGILLLRQQLVRLRHERTLEITKFRGSLVLYGAHTFRIGDDGITVFPQLEGAHSPALSRGAMTGRISTGVPGLDEMLGGGYPPGSVTAITGPEGAGKTLLGLQYLAGASVREPALLFSLNESGEMAEGIGGAFGIDLAALCKSGALHLAGQPRFGESLDEVGYRLLQAVQRSGARRLFIDGLVSVIATPAYQERGAAFFEALFRELRRLRATSVFSVRLRLDGTAPLLDEEVSPLADNTVRLRVLERSHTMVRTVSIGKVQASRHDLSVRELELTPSGLRVGARLADASGRPDP